MTFDRPEQLLGVLIIEALIGYPLCFPHPVVWIGKLISTLDRRWNKGSRRRFAGLATAVILIALGGGVGVLVEHLASGWIGTAVVILIATTGIAQRSLHEHVSAVVRPLCDGNIDAARDALSRIVGRDTAALDASGIAAAATETLAESFCDGVIAPAFWFLILGLPGLFAFKCISTADSMIGHFDERYREFGWASARIDDVMNWVPARLAGGLICLAGTGGWRVMLRDAGKHLSPNAGWPESAMAGALKVRLGGGATYEGEWIAREILGNGECALPSDLTRALSLYGRACLIFWAMTGGLIWLR